PAASLAKHGEWPSDRTQSTSGLLFAASPDLKTPTPAVQTSAAPPPRKRQHSGIPESLDSFSLLGIDRLNDGRRDFKLRSNVKGRASTRFHSFDSYRDC